MSTRNPGKRIDLRPQGAPLNAAEYSFSTSRSIDQVPDFFGDDKSPHKLTYRHGILGDHYQVSGTLVDYSSMIDADEQIHWVSEGVEEEYLIYDFGEKIGITEVNFKFPGKGGAGKGSDSESDNMNPKSVLVSFSNADSLKEANKGQWVSLKRSFVAQEATKLHLAWRSAENARFYKITVGGGWENCSNLAITNIQFIAEDSESRKKCTGLKQLSDEHSAQLGRLCNIFDESSTLSEKQKEVRRLARKHNIPLGDAENLRIKFDKYDDDKSGYICKEEFKYILSELIKIKNPLDIPEERFNHYWREVDSDGSGAIEFEEFLLWYQSILKAGSLNPEAFYATFGVGRLNTLSKRLAKTEGETND